MWGKKNKSESAPSPEEIIAMPSDSTVPHRCGQPFTIHRRTCNPPFWNKALHTANNRNDYRPGGSFPRSPVGLRPHGLKDHLVLEHVRLCQHGRQKRSERNGVPSLVGRVRAPRAEQTAATPAV